MKRCIFELLPSLGDGGAEILVKDYCLHIDKELFNIIIITINPPKKDSACYRTIRSNGIEVIQIYSKDRLFKCGFTNRFWNKFCDSYFVSNRLLKLVQQYHPIAIHAHLSVLRYLKHAESRIKGVRLLATCHNEFDKNFNIPIELKSAQYLSRKGRIRFIALHKKMQEEINQRLRCNNTIIVNNAIDFNRFVNNYTKEEVRKTIGIPQDAFVVGHVGRFNDVKNHSFLVDIFSEIKKIKPNTYLLMVGNGSNKEKIIRKLNYLNLSSCSQILSNRNDVEYLLKSMDVFVFPSLFEGLPVSLVEAQVAGIRCVVSNTITEECFFSENLVSLSINETAEKWAEYVIDDTIKGSYYRDINEFDINNEIHKLENLYLGVI